jgi:leucyl/phenylalanyl-tRNA--protein transferase
LNRNLETSLFVPIFHLTDELIFPPVTLSENDGLLAVGGDLSLPRLLLAYSSGLFPWSNEGDPLLWWSPDPRCIFEPGVMHVSRSLAKTLRQGRFHVSYNLAFDKVIICCARLRIEDGTGTWINQELHRSFLTLHRLGYAHSVECWYGDSLVGGIYGLCLGRCFLGESMFHVERDASKVALFHLLQRAEDLGFELVDCQMQNEHLASLGATQIPRVDFLQRLRRGGVSPSIRPVVGSIERQL